jgi:CBS domain-containing protein
MVTAPSVHGPSTTVDELRTFFRDEHVHMALVVDGGRLVGTVERADLVPALDAEAPAASVATLDGRTIRPDAALPETLDAMTRAGRRRLAVTGDDATLVGLLCLKASGLGFCSDDDVQSRRGTHDSRR